MNIATSTTPSCRPGDLMFFWGKDRLSKLISLVTQGPSHVGILTRYQGQLLIAESTTLCTIPCVAQQKLISGVQVHNIRDRIQEYEGCKIEHAPLLPECRLTLSETERLEQLITDYFGTEYDYFTAGLSATNWLKLLPYPDKHSLFCSALVVRCYNILNRMNWCNPETYNPAGLRRTLYRHLIIDRGRTWTDDNNVPPKEVHAPEEPIHQLDDKPL